jgi:hypothetical protein
MSFAPAGGDKAEQAIVSWERGRAGWLIRLLTEPKEDAGGPPASLSERSEVFGESPIGTGS